MKYGESTFDILYLLFAIVCGILILRRANSRIGKLMGAAALTLGLGDAFHLIPRVLNYFVDADFTAALGIGKLVTLSFLFYIPVAVAAGIVPVLGMLMLPKTVCCILILAAFYAEAVRKQN